MDTHNASLCTALLTIRGTMEQKCGYCLQHDICKVREYFLSGKTPADELIKLVAEDSDYYAKVRSGIDSVLAENCQYYTDVKLA